MSHLWSPKLSTHVEVSDCFFENGGAKDVPVLGVDGAAVSGIGAFWRVERCQVINCYRGFEIENSGRNVIEQVRITDNTLTGIADLGVMLFATNGDGSLFRDISITGNTFTDFHSSDPACSATAIRLAGGWRIRIQNNTVVQMGHQGIVVVSDVEVSDLKISGNVVSGAGNHGIAVHRLESSIANVSDCSEAGIRVIDCADVLVSANLCYNNGRLSEAGGIELFGADTTRALVKGNKCYDTQPTRTQAYGIYLGPGVSGAMIRDNYCPDSLHTRAGIRDLGVATDLGGNKTTTQGLFDGGVLTSAVLINTPLAASIGVRPDGLVTLNWQPISSLTYRVEYKDSLVAPAWTQLTNYQATVGNAATVFDNMGANRKRYYRIREIEPPFRPLGGPEGPLSGL